MDVAHASTHLHVMCAYGMLVCCACMMMHVGVVCPMSAIAMLELLCMLTCGNYLFEVKVTSAAYQALTLASDLICIDSVYLGWTSLSKLLIVAR